MREILFRGKPLNNGKFVFGCYYKQSEFYGDKVDDHIIITSHEDLSYDQQLDYYDVKPETVGQFTGLTDKNGKKIFEGDIVLYEWYECKPMKFQIEYVCGEFLAVPVKKREDVWAIRISGQGENLEVIGNIHDNHDLLKGGAEA